VQTSRAIPNSKPEFIIRDDENGTCALAEVAISGDRNVTKKEAGTVNFRLCNRITARVKCKVQMTPAIMGQLEPSENHPQDT
jgi:hypothetical protein